MLTRLRPLEVTMVFKDRGYKLGETIDVHLEIKARRDVVVREGRVDLICQEKYKQNLTVTVTRAPAPGSGGAPLMTFKETKQVAHSRDETYRHSGAIFLSNVRIRSGATARHRVRLEIGPESPQHVSEPTVTREVVSWALVAAIDVAQARDVELIYPISVALV